MFRYWLTRTSSTTRITGSPTTMGTTPRPPFDGCTRWGAFLRVVLPSAIPAISALAVLCWLFTWNEFLFALILTGNRVPMITVVMAQFVTEMGLRWNLMAATAVMALLPAFLIALFGQKYVIRGLRI